MSNDSSESRMLRREVDENLVRARRALSEYQQAAADGTVTHRVQSLLRDTAIDLFNTLKQWRDDPQVNEVWDEHNLDQFDQLLRHQTNVGSHSHPRLSSPGQNQQQLAVANLTPTQLVDVIDGLTEVAKELGFAPETSDRTPLEIGTVRDIRWLINTREQDKALEELTPPENEPEKITDGGVAVSNGQGNGPGPNIETAEASAQRYPFRGPFFQLINDRKSKGQDAKIAVSSANAETGVGKSTCAYYLAHILDTSPEGYFIENKATLQVNEFLNAYDHLPKGSALILDEAEQLTGRRAMSGKNVKAGERWQMRRVQEICSLLTLPKFSVLDPLMKDLVDFRIEIERRGVATIYKKSHRPFGDTWWQAIQQFEYPDMDVTRGMQALHSLKDEFNELEDEGMVSESEVEEAVEKASKETEREARDRMIKRLSKHGLSQKDIATELEEEYGEDSDLAVSRRRVGHILNEVDG